MGFLVGLLLIYLFVSIFINAGQRYKNVSFYLNVIIFTIVTGTLYEIPGNGGDYDSYRNMFNAINDFILPDKEVGFYLLNFFVRQFTDKYSVTFFIFILIINFLIIKMIYKYSNNIELSLLIYIILGGYITSTNILRQFVAVAIYFYSVKYLIEKRYIKYLLMSLLAFQFHVTSIIPVVITPIVSKMNEKISQNYLKYFIGINLLIVIEPVIRKIGIEAMGNGYGEGNFFYGSSILHYIVQLAFVALYAISIKKVNNEVTKIFINLATISSTFTLLSNNMVLYARIASFFSIFHSIALSNIMYEYKNIKEKRVLYYFIFIGLSIYYFLLTSKSFNMESYIIDYLKNILVK